MEVQQEWAGLAPLHTSCFHIHLRSHSRWEYFPITNTRLTLSSSTPSESKSGGWRDGFDLFCAPPSAVWEEGQDERAPALTPVPAFPSSAESQDKFTQIALPQRLWLPVLLVVTTGIFELLQCSSYWVPDSRREAG